MSSPHATNSRKWMLSKQMLGYVTIVLRRLGRDFTRCELCGGSTEDHHELHHERYEGATIMDMKISCRSCNRLAENRGLQ